MPPFDLVLDAFLYAVAPAGVTAALLLLVVTQLGGAKAAPFGAALALVAGVYVGWRLRGTLTLVPGSSPWNYLPFAAMIALLIGLAVRWPRLPRAAGWLLRLVCAGGVAWWVIAPASREQALWLPALFAAIVFAEWLLLEHVAAQPPDGMAVFGFAMSAFAAAAVLIHAGSARLTDAATVLAAACAGISVIAWWRRVDAGGAIPGAAVLLAGLLPVGQQETFSEISWHAFALAAAAPLMQSITLLCRHWSRMPLLVLRVLVLLPPLIGAVILARLQAGPLVVE